MRVAVFPKEKSPFEALTEMLSGEREDESSFTALETVLGPLRPLLRQIEAEQAGVLAAPVPTIR